MSSIRSILEEVYNAGEGRDFRQEGTMSDSIDQALSDISKIIDEEVIGDMEYRETEDMSLKTWSAEDLKAFGRNELRNEQREKLNEILGDK